MSQEAAGGRGPAANRAERLVGLAGLVGGCAYLLARLAPGIGGKPLHPDEAVTGLVAARPLPEMLATVLLERGGPPLHFLSAHLALLIHPSAETLRWLSVVFALGTVVLCYDLGRRIAGHTAGAAGALVAATSTTLGQLGTFGRMYAAFAFAAALAAVTFYRALEQRTTGAAVLAALAAVLAAAAHTYGIFIVLAEAVVALAVWRGRPLRAGVPVVLAGGLLLVPVLLAYARLSERFGVRLGEDDSLASPRSAARQVHYALASISGGRLVVLLFAIVAAVGMIVVFERQPAFLALCAAVVAPPVLYLVVAGSSTVGLSPRHLVYALPVWTSLLGAGFARSTGRLPPVGQAALLAAVALVGIAFQSSDSGDPRAHGSAGVPAASRQALETPAAWLRARVEPTDVLYQYSTPFLAALESTQHAMTVGPGPGRLLERGLERVDYPVSGVVVALPVAGAELDARALAERLGTVEIGLTPQWLVVRRPGEFSDEEAVLLAMRDVLRAAREALSTAPPHIVQRFESPLAAVCGLIARAHGPASCRGPASS